MLNSYKTSKPLKTLALFKYINLLGEYNFDVKNVLESDELRPLNINNL